MKISEKWLREWIDPQVGFDRIAEQLTMAGLEVGSVESLAPEFSGVVVGLVREVSKHPDADTLSVCVVDAGQEQQQQIVCGAPNVTAGCRYPVALPGARLPGGLKIRAAKLRGVRSEGMLCSEVELGLGEGGEGIMELAVDAPVGMALEQYLRLDDAVMELELTPNRGDCLGVAGVAREIAVLNEMSYTGMAVDPVAAASETVIPVELVAAEGCPVYIGRAIEGINMQAVIPDWMREKLRRAGLRPLHPVVDVTNYVLLELGQPMHAFDLSKLDGEIRVRLAEQGEAFTLLDGKEIRLDSDMLVIADHGSPVALAGIMGGLDSSVTTETNSIFLESAFFSPLAIVGRGRRVGLHTDASHRFERGVDPSLQRRAMERATALILEICGGTPGPVIEARAEAHIPVRRPIELRRQRLCRLLGTTVPDEAVSAILQRLGMTIEATAEGWHAIPPMHRFDMEIEEDLIEEVARVYGYDRIPETPLHSDVIVSAAHETVVEQDVLRDRVISLGYQEVISYSFVDPILQDMLFSAEQGIRLSNPISSELSDMRISLWPGLIQALEQNVSRQQDRVRIFETGVRFVRQGTENKEINTVSGLIFGPIIPEQWSGKPRLPDFFDLKADVEAILQLSGDFGDFRFEPSAHPALHPGQSAAITRGERHVGWIGAIHPAIQSRLGLRHPAFVFELDVEGVTSAKIPVFEGISKFPRVRRDLALVLPEAIPAADILAVARRAAGELLVDCRLFDVYQGSGIDSGLKSVALGLILQESSRTLTDQEADHVVSVVGSALNNEYGAQIRD